MSTTEVGVQGQESRLPSTISRISVPDGVVGQIVALIREGPYTPGTRLPGERTLAKTLKVSRTSIREALQQLETAGLLERRQGLGTFIKDPNAASPQLALVPRLLTDQNTLGQIFEIREIIEVAATGRAAERATPAHIATMQEWVDALEHHIEQNDQDGTIIADVEFHRQIVLAAGNEILSDLMDSIIDLLYEMRYASLSIPELLLHVRASHQAILGAIRQGDSAAARQAMKEHLRSVSVRVSEYWARQGNQVSTRSTGRAAER